MENSEATENVICEVSEQQLLSIENNCQPVENVLLNNDDAEPSKIVDQISNSENQIPVESTDSSTKNADVTAELSSIVPTDNCMPPLPPLPKNDDGQMQQPPAAPISADYNMQNYANYNNYMYNYNNYYGYPYPQYQWDYNSQQYYQPYQNFYNYNFNQANQTQTSKPPPPPPDAVQLPVEEKPANKTNTVVDDSNRYSPTAETDDDDPMKGSENYKSDVLIEKPTQTINAVPFQTVTSEQIVVQQNIPESIDNIVQQTIDPPTLPSITAVQQQVPVIAQVQLYNIQAQQPSYPINPQSQMQSTETVNEVINQQQTSPALNGKDDSIEKVSKASTVLGKSQAKKRLMAFSMMKQKLQEQNNSVDNQSPDIGEGNDGEFVPEHNVFQTVTKKKIVTNKKVAKVIKAQQTIEQIEEMKKDELLQGNNAALYQHLLRSGGNEAPILQKLGIESLAEKYSAKIREQDKRSSRHHHRRRDESRRSHKYRRRSHSKSRSRSRSTEKPKMRALEVKSWKDFVKGGFHFDRFRRFKMDEAKEIKDKERKSRKKKRHGDSRSDGKNHKNESNIPSEIEKGIGDQKLRHNLLDRKKEILKGLEVNTHEGDFTKDFPSYIIRCTKNKPSIKFSENPANATYHLQNRQQMLATLLPEIEAIVLKFLSSMKPKKLKENHADNNCNSIDEKLLIMMKDKNIYPFKGWWPITNFIVTQVKEDPNIEIDVDVLMNEITTSKRTKKSRFNDDTSLVELRPTVPSKWDSDYDGSPAAENKVAYVEVTQSVEMNTNDDVCTIKREENNSLDISRQEEAMDTASDVGEDEPKIEVNVSSVLPVQIQEPQGHTKLNTEYEEFLKIVKAEKEECDISITTNANETTQTDIENNLSMKSVSLNNDSIQDESEEYMSTKSSDESVSLQNAAEESDSNDRSFIEDLSTINLKNRKKKKSSSKKSKTLKNKGSKKKRHKSSSSESSQDSESESDDSSSDDSDSESTDSTSTVEKKKKKKSKKKKKRKTKTNYKKKHRSDKNKTKSPEDEKDANSSILNLIEKALNVEIKKRPSDSKEPKHKKKKRKHEKKENQLNEENDDKFEKVKDCLKETITKLVKTEKVNKSQSLSCDDTVIEVLKYLNDKEKKNKKSKKSLKRKHESDISDDEETPKKSKLVDSCFKSKDNDKKKKSKNKKSVDSDEHIIKKKSKKKSKTTDTSEVEDVEVLNQNKSKSDSVQFFELRPNEWNTIKKSSRRGVVHHSEVKNKNKTSPVHGTSKCNKNVRKKKSDSLNLIDKCPPTSSSKNKYEIPKSPNEFKEFIGEKERKKQSLKNIKNDKIDVSKNLVEEKKLINFKNSDHVSKEKLKDCIEENYDSLNKSADKCPNDNSEEHDTDKDLKSIFKPQTQSIPTIDLYDKPPTTCTVFRAVTESVSYRDKVKMNLKKLSTCQNIPFGFGFSPPISLIKSDKIEDLKVTQKEEESKSDTPKVINFPQTQVEKQDVTKKELLKINIETNNKALDHSYDWDDSEGSSTDHSLVTSTNTSEHSSDEGENEQINSNLLKNDSPNMSNKNETLSNDSEFKELGELTSNVLETNSSSDSVIKEQEIPLVVDNFLMEKEITTLSNLTVFSGQHLVCNAEGLENDVISVKMEKNDSDPMYSQKSSTNILEVPKSNNELITQWTSDWINLDKSVTEINHSSSFKSGNEELQLKKKSRWDKQPMDNKIGKLQSFNNGQEEYKDETETSILTDELKCTPSNNEDDLNNEQNQTCEIMSINCMNDDYHEINPYAYDDYFQTYEQYTGLPMYSEMKTIEHDLLSPIDYSVYENFNPNYNYHTEDYDMWKSVDTDTSEHEIKAIPTIDETVSQLVNVFENFPSDNVGQVKFSKEDLSNENIGTIISGTQEEIVKNEKSNSASRDELFVKLYHQHFQHYNQNPIKYSLSDPVIINTDKVKVNIPDGLTSQEKLSETEQKSDDIMSIPLQTRAYVCILDDNNTNLYLTSDNYMAYCAVEDRCMVHISVNACNRDGVGNDVRHCFNVNLSGSINEYWLHADLIPFHAPSDAESGVFSDDERDSLDSDSGHEEDVNNDKNENDDDIIESEWEIVDNIHDNVNSWLDEPYILKKYNIEHDVSHINQEHYVTSSSECDTDGSEFSDSYVEMYNDKQNINENHIKKSLETKDDNHKYQNMIDEVTPINISENTENSDSLIKTEECLKSSEKLVLDVEIKNEIDTLEVVNGNNITSKINLENNDVLRDLVEKVNNDNVSVISEEKINNDTVSVMSVEKENNNGNESGVFMKEEVTVADLSMMETIINQKILIQKLKIRAKEKIREKLPDTIMISYSDNMDTIKHPFLGLFQPPTNSILSKPGSTKSSRTLNLSKRVTFADGIRPGDNLAASPTHDDSGCPLSPPPLKTLMRETLKFKRNMYPFKRSKVRTKLTMVKKKVAKVTPSIKETNPSVIEYYVSRRRLADLPIGEVPNSSFLSSDHSSNNNEGTEKNSTPPRPTREVTPVPSDTECWNDDDTIKNNR